MAENIKILRERIALEKDIRDIKSKAANDAKGFSDQDAKALREKEARIRAVKKLEAQASKEKDAASSKLFGLQSRVNELQDNFVKSLIVKNF